MKVWDGWIVFWVAAKPFNVIAILEKPSYLKCIPITVT